MKEVEAFLKALVGDGVEVQVINLGKVESEHNHEGLTDGECAACKREHANPKDKETAQAQIDKALKRVREEMADTLARLDLWKKLEASLMTPIEERTKQHMVDELVVMIQLRVLGL